jgi:hypothetical protein
LSLLTLAALAHLCVPIPARAAQAVPDQGRDMLVPGGTAAWLQAAGVRVAVEPDRALLVLIRHLHAGRNEPAQVDALVARAASQPAPRGPERVPGLLPLRTWQRAVFARDIPSDGLAAAILRDRQASFLYQGLFALDEATLGSFAGDPALVGAVYKQSAAAFAAYSDGIRIRGGRVQLPGGPPAEAAWERILGASAGDPARFVPSLLERDQGRVAQLFEALGRLDPPHLAFALGPSAAGVPALVAAAAGFDAYVQLPFASWSEVDLPFLLGQVRVMPDGRMAPPGVRAFWEAVLSGDTATRAGAESTPGEATAAWLVERFAALPPASRRPRLDALLFAQRLAAAGRAESTGGEWLEVAASFPAWQTLFLTLEQMGATDPDDYRAAARAASAVTAGYGESGASRRLAVFQSAIALLARLTRVGTLPPTVGLGLARDLFGRAASDEPRYAPAMVDWVECSLLPRLSDADDGRDAESRLLDGLAGPIAGASASIVEWEGHRYVVDLAGAERQRLASVREGQGGRTLDEVIALQRAGPGRAGDLETALADVLVAYVYGLATDPDVPMVPDDGPWRRHDFGLGGTASSGPWRFAALKAGRGATGSLLGIERTLAREALRPTMMGLPPRPPTLTLEDTTGLAESVVALNPSRLRDDGRDLLAAAMRAGRTRLVDAARRPDDLESLLASAGVDGIRRRLARLAATDEASRVFDYVSLAEILQLGQEGERIPASVLDPWGTAARLVDGSLGQRMPARLAWRERSGRPGSGLLSACVADLQLRVAAWLAERHLPAPLAGPVLSLATWDLAMTVQVANADDWLPVVRAAQNVPPQRLEDYVSALAAGGPLVPAGAGQ